MFKWVVLAALGARFTAASSEYQIAKLLADTPNDYAEFGVQIAIDGDALVVGARRNEHSDLSTAGTAHVFLRDAEGDGWKEVQELIASDANAEDWFGISVAIEGTVIVVGASGDDDEGVDFTGAAYVFRSSSDRKTWSQYQKLTANDAGENHHFGTRLAISGDIIVVGAYGDDEKGSWAGSAYVFKSKTSDAGGPWELAQKLVADDAKAGDWFGYGVAIDGDFIVVAAEFDDTSGDADKGSAYIFKTKDGGESWYQANKVTPTRAVAGTRVGTSLAMSGDVFVLGARYYDTSTSEDAGAVFVFHALDDDGSSWGEVDVLTASDLGVTDWFGISVDIDGTDIVVGANGNDDAGSNSGSAYVFRTQDATSWTQINKLTADDANIGDFFGSSVAISGNIVVAGADHKDLDEIEQAGAVYVYAIEGSPTLEPTATPTTLEPTATPTTLEPTAAPTTLESRGPSSSSKKSGKSSGVSVALIGILSAVAIFIAFAVLEKVTGRVVERYFFERCCPEKKGTKSAKFPMKPEDEKI